MDDDAPPAPVPKHGRPDNPDKDKRDRRTVEGVIDRRAAATLRKLRDKGHFTELHGVLSTGKEANVYSAELVVADEEEEEGGGEGEGAGVVDASAPAEGAPRDGLNGQGQTEQVEEAAEATRPSHHRPPRKYLRAVKVYSTAILAFRDRTRYMEGDRRFHKVPKHNNYNMVCVWAEKEFRNLVRLHGDGIPCPRPYKQKDNVLVMRFLGDRNGNPFPRLVDAVIDDDEDGVDDDEGGAPVAQDDGAVNGEAKENAEVAGVDDGDAKKTTRHEKWHSLYVQALSIVRRMYRVSRLVHGDLSEYNLLVDPGVPRLLVIDVSQSVGPDHPDSLVFLRRDVANVNRFFAAKGVDTLLDRAVFEFVTLPKKPTEPHEVDEAIAELFRARDEEVGGQGNDDEARAQREVDNEVFRNRFIPKTLQEAYDADVTTARGATAAAGANADLERLGLLADVKEKLTLEDDGGAGEGGEGDEGGEDDDDDDGSDARSNATQEWSSSDEDGKRPRGHRHEPRDEKKDRKRAVKEGKREKRQTKMKKSEKKRAIQLTSSRRH